MRSISAIILLILKSNLSLFRLGSFGDPLTKSLPIMNDSVIESLLNPCFGCCFSQSATPGRQHFEVHWGLHSTGKNHEGHQQEPDEELVRCETQQFLCLESKQQETFLFFSVHISKDFSIEQPSEHVQVK